MQKSRSSAHSQGRLETAYFVNQIARIFCVRQPWSTTPFWLRGVVTSRGRRRGTVACGTSDRPWRWLAIPVVSERR